MTLFSFPIEKKITDPTAVLNNKVGLYIYSVKEYADLASQLVNSNGGDWGYALVPYAVYDHDFGKWDQFFRKLDQNHLIPIIQLWDLRDSMETAEAAKFLDSLPWPITNHYISVYNEVNDARFWNDQIDPKGYAHVLDDTINVFKAQNPQFFMINGAFNASARTGGNFMDEEEFLVQMDKEKPGIFKKLDGWASHSYPQPNFSGQVLAAGRDSIKAYSWELNLLKTHFGITSLPVFITETGWAHLEGETLDYKYYPSNQTALFICQAFEEVWLKDDRVVAVTPFTIRYNHPEDHFNWIDKNGKPYAQFWEIQKISKVAGEPNLSPWFTLLPNIEGYIKSLFLKIGQMH